jgi:hypothetical protein
VHKALLAAGCPYFATLFSTRLPTIEIAENKVILDSEVDCEEAWSMVIEYLYLGYYGITGRHLTTLESIDAVRRLSAPIDAAQRVHIDAARRGQALFLNARIYVLALKLCMEDLKLLVLKRAAALISELYLSTLSPNGLRKMVEIVYPNTPDADEGEGQSADESEYKGPKSSPSSVTDFWQMRRYRLIQCASLLQSTQRLCSPNSGKPRNSWIWYRIGASSREICSCTPRTVLGCPELNFDTLLGWMIS